MSVALPASQTRPPPPAVPFAAGIWRDNPALVQLLGLCPLLAITTTVIQALTLGLVTLFTLCASNTMVSVLRRWLRPEIRIAVAVLIIAGAVSAAEMILAAWFHVLYLKLGIYVPLVVTNCAILARAEAYARHHPPFAALRDGAAYGTGFLLALLVLGALREWLGHGSLLRDAELLFGSAGAGWVIGNAAGHHGLLIALLPPGAFILLALIIVARRWIERQIERQSAPPAVPSGLLRPAP